MASSREALTLHPVGDSACPGVRIGGGGRLDSPQKSVSSATLSSFSRTRPSIVGSLVFSTDRPDFLNCFALAVFHRHMQSGRARDVEETTTFFRKALIVCPLCHPNHLMFFNNSEVLFSVISGRFKIWMGNHIQP
jgi:hypothetical protein